MTIRSSLCVAILAFVLVALAANSEVLELAEMNTRQIAALDLSSTIVIIPGGILEEHGPYLPSFSDGYLNEDESWRLARDLSERDWTVLMFPMIPLGSGGGNEIGAHHVFPGTYTIRPETLRSIFMDIAIELGEQGFCYVFVMHLHGAPSHNMALDQASQFFRDEYKAQMHHLSGYAAIGYGVLDLFSEDALEEEGFSIHAGAIETSITMYLRPDLVTADVMHAKPMTGQDLEENVRIAKDPNWPGYFGSPRQANTALGKSFVDRRYKNILELALRVLDGDDLSDEPRMAAIAYQEGDPETNITRQSREENARRAMQQETWLERAGAEL